MANPNERTLQHLKKQGRLVAVVERWNPHVKIRQDMWGMIDIVELGPEGRLHGHQPTTQAHVAAHIDKIRRAKHYVKFLQDGGKLFVWGWALRGERGKRKLWTFSLVEMTLESHPPLPPLVSVAAAEVDGQAPA